MLLGKKSHDYEDEHDDEDDSLKEAEDAAGNAVEPSQADHLESLGEQISDESNQEHDQKRNEDEGDRVGHGRNAEEGEKHSGQPVIIPGGDRKSQDESAKRAHRPEKSLRKSGNDRGNHDNDDGPVHEGHGDSLRSFRD